MNPVLMEILEYLAGVALGMFLFFFPEFLQMGRFFKSFTEFDRIVGKVVGVGIALFSLGHIWGVLIDALAELL